MGVPRHIMVEEEDWVSFKDLTKKLNTTPGRVINLMIRQANMRGCIPFEIRLWPETEHKDTYGLKEEPVVASEPVVAMEDYTGKVEEKEETADLALTSEALFG